MGLSFYADPMKIATYNINGINGRLEILLRWLKAAQPDTARMKKLSAAVRAGRSARAKREARFRQTTEAEAKTSKS